MFYGTIPSRFLPVTERQLGGEWGASGSGGRVLRRDQVSHETPVSTSCFEETCTSFCFRLYLLLSCLIPCPSRARRSAGSRAVCDRNRNISRRCLDVFHKVDPELPPSRPFLLLNTLLRTFTLYRLCSLSFSPFSRYFYSFLGVLPRNFVVGKMRECQAHWKGAGAAEGRYCRQIRKSIRSGHM